MTLLVFFFLFVKYCFFLTCLASFFTLILKCRTLNKTFAHQLPVGKTQINHHIVIQPLSFARNTTQTTKLTKVCNDVASLLCAFSTPEYQAVVGTPQAQGPEKDPGYKARARYPLGPSVSSRLMVLYEASRTLKRVSQHKKESLR